jgi:Holliday junction resolvase
MEAQAVKNEHSLQRELTGALKRRGFLAFGFTRPPQKGFPDILAFKNGHTVCIEVKRSGNRASEEQLRMLKLFAGYGCAVFIVHSAIEVERMIRVLEEDERYRGSRLDTQHKGVNEAG